MQSANSLVLLFTLILTIEYLTFFAAIFFLHKKRNGIWRLFIPMLFIIICAETLGWYWNNFLIKYYHFQKPNAWIFNFNMIITDIFILWLLSTTETLGKARRIIYGLMMVFFLVAIINLLFIQGLWKYNQYTETAGDIIQVITCCYVFYSFIKEEAFRNLLTYEYFWLANGILFSAMGSAFLYNFPNALANFQKHTGISIFTIINDMLNILLYGSLIIAFICRNRNTKLLQA